MSNGLLTLLSNSGSTPAARAAACGALVAANAVSTPSLRLNVLKVYIKDATRPQRLWVDAAPCASLVAAVRSAFGLDGDGVAAAAVDEEVAATAHAELVRALHSVVAARDDEDAMRGAKRRRIGSSSSSSSSAASLAAAAAAGAAPDAVVERASAPWRSGIQTLCEFCCIPRCRLLAARYVRKWIQTAHEECAELAASVVRFTRSDTALDRDVVAIVLQLRLKAMHAEWHRTLIARAVAQHASFPRLCMRLVLMHSRGGSYHGAEQMRLSGAIFAAFATSVESGSSSSSSSDACAQFGVIVGELATTTATTMIPLDDLVSNFRRVLGSVDAELRQAKRSGHSRGRGHSRGWGIDLAAFVRGFLSQMKVVNDAKAQIAAGGVPLLRTVLNVIRAVVELRAVAVLEQSRDEVVRSGVVSNKLAARARAPSLGSSSSSSSSARARPPPVKLRTSDWRSAPCMRSFVTNLDALLQDVVAWLTRAARSVLPPASGSSNQGKSQCDENEITLLASALRGALCFDTYVAKTKGKTIAARSGGMDRDRPKFPLCLEVVPCSEALFASVLALSHANRALFPPHTTLRLFCDLAERESRWLAQEESAASSSSSDRDTRIFFRATTDGGAALVDAALVLAKSGAALRTRVDVGFALTKLCCFSLHAPLGGSASSPTPSTSLAQERRDDDTFAAHVWKRSRRARGLILRLIAGPRAAAAAVAAAAAAASSNATAARAAAIDSLSRDDEIRLGRLDHRFALGARARSSREPAGPDLLLSAISVCGGAEPSAVWLAQLMLARKDGRLDAEELVAHGAMRSFPASSAPPRPAWTPLPLSQHLSLEDLCTLAIIAHRPSSKSARSPLLRLLGVVPTFDALLREACCSRNRDDSHALRVLSLLVKQAMRGDQEMQIGATVTLVAIFEEENGCEAKGEAKGAAASALLAVRTSLASSQLWSWLPRVTELPCWKEPQLRACTAALANKVASAAVVHYDIAGAAEALRALRCVHGNDTLSFARDAALCVGSQLDVLSRALSADSLLAAEMCRAAASSVLESTGSSADSLADTKRAIRVLVATAPAGPHSNATKEAHTELCSALFTARRGTDDAPALRALGVRVDAWFVVLRGAHDPWLAAAVVRSAPLVEVLSHALHMASTLPRECQSALRADARLSGMWRESIDEMGEADAAGESAAAYSLAATANASWLQAAIASEHATEQQRSPVAGTVAGGADDFSRHAASSRVVAVTAFVTHLRQLAEGRRVRRAFRGCMRLAARHAVDLCDGAAPALRAVLALLRSSALLPLLSDAQIHSTQLMCRTLHILCARPLRERIFAVQLEEIWRPLCNTLFRALLHAASARGPLPKHVETLVADCVLLLSHYATWKGASSANVVRTLKLRTPIIDRHGIALLHALLDKGVLCVDALRDLLRSVHGSGSGAAAMRSPTGGAAPKASGFTSAERDQIVALLQLKTCAQLPNVVATLKNLDIVSERDPQLLLDRPIMEALAALATASVSAAERKSESESERAAAVAAAATIRAQAHMLLIRSLDAAYASQSREMCTVHMAQLGALLERCVRDGRAEVRATALTHYPEWIASGMEGF